MNLNDITEEEFLIKIGQNIVGLREEQGMKQIELAVKLNIEDSALRRIESGRTNPTTKTLFRIAKELNVPIERLFQ